MVQLASTTYVGANQTHLAELAGPSRGGTGPAWAPPESDSYSSLVRRMVDRRYQRDGAAMPRPTSSPRRGGRGRPDMRGPLTPVSGFTPASALSRARADTAIDNLDIHEAHRR